jgi:hypothetical protein
MGNSRSQFPQRRTQGMVSSEFYPCYAQRQPRGVAQMVSAPVWGTGGRRFESCLPDHFRPELQAQHRDPLACERQGAPGPWRGPNGMRGVPTDAHEVTNASGTANRDRWPVVVACVRSPLPGADDKRGSPLAGHWEPHLLLAEMVASSRRPTSRLQAGTSSPKALG